MPRHENSPVAVFDQINAENKDLILEWANWRAENFYIKERSYNEFVFRLAKFAHFVESMGTESILDVTGDLISQYKDSIMPPRYALETVKSLLAVVKSFTRWANQSGKIAENPLSRFRIPNPSGLPPFIPTARQIFEIRNSPYVKGYMMACMLEWLISTGMRIDELLQVRVCDICWEPKMYDREADRISPYIGASVDLNPAAGYNIKNNLRRKVFVSKLAVKMTKRYMAESGIEAEDNVPLFPIVYATFQERMSYLTTKLNLVDSHGMSKDSDGKLIPVIKRNLDDVDVDASCLNHEIRKRILHLKQRQQTKKPYTFSTGKKIAKVGIREKPKEGRCTAHAFRHFFGVMMYYRDYTGNKHCLDTVSKLMGHKTLKESEKYIRRELQSIRNDKEWKQIMLGNGFEYRNLVRL